MQADLLQFSILKFFLARYIADCVKCLLDIAQFRIEGCGYTTEFFYFSFVLLTAAWASSWATFSFDFF